MRIRRLLEELLGRPPTSKPTGGFRVDHDAVLVPDPQGGALYLPFAELDEIAVVTTDTGPFAEDVFWALQRGDEVVFIPQEVKAFDDLFDIVREWPGFDGESFCQAMSCTENQQFVCWRRETEPPGQRDG